MTDSARQPRLVPCGPVTRACAARPGVGPGGRPGAARRARPDAPQGAPSHVIARVFEADLSAPVVAAGTRIQNVRQI